MSSRLQLWLLVPLQTLCPGEPPGFGSYHSAAGTAQGRETGTAEGCATREAAARERVLQKDHFDTMSHWATPLVRVVGTGWWWLGAAAPNPGSAAALATAAPQMGLHEEEVHRELLGMGRLCGCRGL